jgi:hypothetical protein
MFPIYFFQILATLNLLDAKIDWLGQYCAPEARFVRETGALYVGYVLIGVGLIVTVEYFLWKEIKLCAAFVFSLMNVLARSYFLVVMRSSYACVYHPPADDAYGYDIVGDYAVVVSSTNSAAYIRLIIGLAWSLAVTVLFCYDNADMIKERHVWLLADYFRFLGLVLVKYPRSIMQQTFCAGVTPFSCKIQEVFHILRLHRVRSSHASEPITASIRESLGGSLRSPLVDL